MQNFKAILFLGLIFISSDALAQQTQPTAQPQSLSQRLNAIRKQQNEAQSADLPQSQAIDPALQAAVSELHDFLAKDIVISFGKQLDIRSRISAKEMKNSPVLKANAGREKDVLDALQIGGEQYTLTTMGLDRANMERNILQTMKTDEINKFIALYKSPQKREIEISDAADGVCVGQPFTLSCMWNLPPQNRAQLIKAALDDAEASQSFYMQMEAVRPAWQKFDIQKNKTIEAAAGNKTILSIAKEAAAGGLNRFFKAEFDKRGLVYIAPQNNVK